jgi:hypothetical protein
MYDDGRHYRARYNPAFLGTVRAKAPSLPPRTRVAIAKAYYAGCAPLDLAKEYGITPQNVSLIARRFDQQRYEERRRAYRKRQEDQPKAVEPPKPVIPQIEVADNRTYVVMKIDYSAPIGHGRVQRITLPYVSILGQPGQVR